LVDHLTTVDVHAIQTTLNPQDPVQLLIKQVAALSTKMEKFTKRNRFRCRSRNRARKTNKVRDSLTEEDDKCYYHRKFGKQARNCKPSCKFQTRPSRKMKPPSIGVTGDGLKISPWLHVTDRTTGTTFLIDMDADISLLPITGNRELPRRHHSSYYHSKRLTSQDL